MSHPDAPDVPVAPARRTFFRGASLVWLVPLLAVLVALAVAWQTYSQRGPLIEITFDNASGIAAGETELRYRDVAVGVVERVAFTSSLDRVAVFVRVEKDVASYMDGDAKFWVVRPEVTTRGVTGLDTVLSGVFIEGSWDTQADGMRRRFEGLPQSPLVKGGQKGLRLMLRSDTDQGLTENTPILYKGLEVGRIGAARITQDGSAVYADAIILSPHDRLITTATRFWDTSGFTFSLGPNGAELDFKSIASLVSGGITFDTLVSGGEPPSEGLTYTVYPDEASARNSVFEGSSGRKLTTAVLFFENVAGLTADSPVEMRGLKVGRVVNISGLVDEERFGDSRVRLVAVLEIDISRLGLPGQVGTAEALSFLAERVSEGMRAQLTNASILTGGLKIVLTDVPDAPPADFDPAAEPYPFIPATASDLRDVSATAEGVFERINALPIEDLLSSAIRLMDNAAALVSSPDLQQAPSDLRAILADVQGVVGNADLQRLPADVSATVAELQAAIGDLRATLGRFDEQQGVDRALAAVDAAAAAAEGVTAAVSGVPDLLAELQGAAGDFRPLADDVQQTLARLQGLLDQAQTLLAAPETQGLPTGIAALVAELQATATELQGTIATLNRDNGVERLLAAVDAAAAAADSVSGSVEGVPALVEDLRATAARARDLPLDQVMARIDAVLASADALIGTDAARALPTELTATLTDLRGLTATTGDLIGSDGVQALPGDVSTLLAELQGTATDLRATLAQVTEQRGVERLLAAIDATATAANDVSGSVEGVPALVTEIRAVADQARDLPLRDLTERASDLLASANGLVASEDTARLPARLNEALSELAAILADIRQGGAVENVNQTLAAAQRAAETVADSAARLPSTFDRIDGLLGDASTTIAGYGQTSELNREIRSALREVQRAADAVASLARALERRPNSIILGR
ncbi:MAG: MlaD family protein [Tranquillimonas sp.]